MRAPVLLCLLALSACATTVDVPERVSIRAERNFVTGYPAMNPDGTLNVVVEIPAGTNAKWEVLKTGSALEWELEDGRRRVVQYLAYPANYGMVPGTLLPEASGGDGDPLDVIVLGPAIARGRVVAVRPIGVLRLLDDGERDDKILAVPLDGPFAAVDGMDALGRSFAGVTSILETWFTSYKGPGHLKAQGFAEVDAARATVRDAIAAFEASR